MNIVSPAYACSITFITLPADIELSGSHALTKDLIAIVELQLLTFRTLYHGMR